MLEYDVKLYRNGVVMNVDAICSFCVYDLCFVLVVVVYFDASMNTNQARKISPKFMQANVCLNSPWTCSTHARSRHVCKSAKLEVFMYERVWNTLKYQSKYEVSQGIVILYVYIYIYMSREREMLCLCICKNYIYAPHTHTHAPPPHSYKV